MIDISFPSVSPSLVLILLSLSFMIHIKMMRKFDWETFYLRKTVIMWTKRETLKLRYWDLALLFIKPLKELSQNQLHPELTSDHYSSTGAHFTNNFSIVIQISLCCHPICNYTPRTTKLLGWYIGFTPSVRPSVHPSVRPACRVRSVTSTVLDGFFPY